MDILHRFIANSLEYIGFYQMKELAHTCAFARNAVLAWLRAHPWVTSPLGDVFARSSLTLLKQITQDHHEKKVSIAQRYVDVGAHQLVDTFEELIMRACRHDDVELVQHIVRDILEVYESIKDDSIVWRPFANLVIASLPICYGHQDIHDFYQNKMHSARVFMYLIGHGSDGVAPFDALCAHNVGEPFEYIASGAVITSNETLLCNLANACDLTGISPEKYYRHGFSGRISSRIHELACNTGMRMREYDIRPNILSAMIDGSDVPETFIAHDYMEKYHAYPIYYKYFIDRIIARERYDLLGEPYDELIMRSWSEQPYGCLSIIDIHSQSFANIVREVAKHALHYQCGTTKDVLITWFIRIFRNVLTIPVHSVRRILSFAQYHAYIRLCAIFAFDMIKNEMHFRTDIAYLCEFDSIRASINIDESTDPFGSYDVISTAHELNAGHDAIDAISELHTWVRAHPDIDAPQFLVHTCITASTPCDTCKSRIGRSVWCITDHNIDEHTPVNTKRAYVAKMASAIRDIIAWTRFAHLSAFDKFALGMLFDDTRVMRESMYQVRSDTFLGGFAIGCATNCHVAITYDMLDSTLQANAHRLQDIIGDMSIGCAFSFLRSTPDATLLDIIRYDNGYTVHIWGTLASIVFLTERS